MSQDELARRAGIGVHAVTDIETEQRRVTVTDLVAIARATGRPLSWFLTTDEPGPGLLERPLPVQPQRSTSHDLPLEAVLEIASAVAAIKARYAERQQA